MPKRPSLFAPKIASAPEPAAAAIEHDEGLAASDDAALLTKRPPSRVGKRVLSVYLEPVALKQLRQLALDRETSTQALGEEAVNLLFEKYRLNRSA